MSAQIAWTIGGSDSGGGAGIQADLKTMAAFGIHGCSAITALTAQNTRGVYGISEVPGSFVQQQLDALVGDLRPDAVKLGMLHNVSVIDAVAEHLSRSDAPIICDPVLSSTSGSPLLEKHALSALWQRIIPNATLITPNLDEAIELIRLFEPTHKFDRRQLNSRDKSIDEFLEELAGALLRRGTRAVLLKGGHLDGPFAQDFFNDGERKWWFTSERYPIPSSHGSGCTLSAAIASSLALGHSLLDAIVLAKAYVNQSLRLAPAVGSGHRPLRQAALNLTSSDLPWATATAAEGRKRNPFVVDSDIGFYPIISRVENMHALIAAGATTIQLRIKDLDDDALRAEIEAAVRLAQASGCRLYVNDYWQDALAAGAYGVHLGQSDLEYADCEQLRKSGLRLGVSTHCHFEVARALALQPSYIAIGPIHQTTTKQMPFAPQGVDGFRYWKRLLSYPLVAIGGMFLDNSQLLIDAGADGIAVVRDIVCDDPFARARQWVKSFPVQSVLPFIAN